MQPKNEHKNKNREGVYPAAMSRTDLDANPWGLLVRLAAKGALSRTLKVSTAALAEEMKVSQQTVSRWLMQLTALGLVERKYNHVRLTPEAKDNLARRKAILEASLAASTEVLLQGRVVEGMGEGKYYLSQPEYQQQLRKCLGYPVFPGTLNLQLSGEQQALKRQLAASPAVELKEFRKNGRTFGGALLFPGEIRKAKGGACAHGAAIMPLKTHHGPDTLELVSAHFLRKKLGLRNGDHVEFRARFSRT